MSVFTELADVKDRTYLDNELAFACLTHTPITPGHTLIIPKREVATFAELTHDELLAIHELTKQVMERLSFSLHAKGYNCAWNQGEDYGQSVPHFHLHIVPRTPSDAGIIDYEPRQLLYRPGSRAVSPEQELSQLASTLRKDS